MNPIKNKIISWNNVKAAFVFAAFAHGVFSGTCFATNVVFCYADTWINGRHPAHSTIWKGSVIAGMNWPIVLYHSAYNRCNRFGIDIIVSNI